MDGPGGKLMGDGRMKTAILIGNGKNVWEKGESDWDRKIAEMLTVGGAADAHCRSKLMVLLGRYVVQKAHLFEVSDPIVREKWMSKLGRATSGHSESPRTEFHDRRDGLRWCGRKLCGGIVYSDGRRWACPGRIGL
jgi:hypothetical protein